MTLIEKAKAIRVSNKRASVIEEELLELALAWTRGDVTGEQCGQVLGTDPGNISSRFGTVLKWAVRYNQITIIKNGTK